MTRDPMDNAAYTRNPPLAGESTADLDAQRRDLKALTTQLTQELDRLKEGGEWREKLAEQCGKTLAAEALVVEMRTVIAAALYDLQAGDEFGALAILRQFAAKLAEPQPE